MGAWHDGVRNAPLAGHLFTAKNRKQMFQLIISTGQLVFPEDFDRTVVDFISRLLTRDRTARLGSGPNGSEAVMNHPFLCYYRFQQGA